MIHIHTCETLNLIIIFATCQMLHIWKANLLSLYKPTSKRSFAFEVFQASYNAARVIIPEPKTPAATY